MNRVSICSDNGLSPICYQAIIWANAGSLSIGPLGTNFNQNTNLLINKNAPENSICEMAAILLRGRWVKLLGPRGSLKKNVMFIKQHYLKCPGIFMPQPLGAGGIMFLGCPSVHPSVRPKPEIPSFDLYMGPLVHPTTRNPFTACPSVHPRFPGICRRTHGGNGLKFHMLMYLDHLQNWLVYGSGLLIFLILALFWLSETGQIWGFRAFPGEPMEEMAWNFACWCILTTFRTE